MRVLVAEDDPFSRRFLVKTLETWGYEVLAVSDGNEALAALSDHNAPQLVLVDWMMPGIDGLELCRRIRSEEADRLVYVIMLTAKDGVEDLVLAMDAGADDYTTKSFDVRELRVRLNAGQRILKLEQSLRKLATRDPLTELWNRAAILDLLDRELSRAGRKHANVGLIMADVDFFKRVNDTHGHAAGDLVLTEVALRLRTGLREYDGVGRWGGEEFLIVLPEATEETGRDVAERLRASVASSPIELQRGVVAVTASFGVAVSYHEHPLKCDALVQLADAALYRAKNAGRNCVETPGGARDLAPSVGRASA